MAPKEFINLDSFPTLISWMVPKGTRLRGECDGRHGSLEGEENMGRWSEHTVLRVQEDNVKVWGTTERTRVRKGASKMPRGDRLPRRATLLARSLSELVLPLLPRRLHSASSQF